MRNANFAGRRAMRPPQRQRGLVLLITLIVLVAMMLAGIGMMRSIDTTTMIAGNVAFREATLQAGDAGMNTAFSKLLQIATNPNDKVALIYSDGDSTAYVNPVTLATAYNCTTMSAYLCKGPGNDLLNFPGYSAQPANACEVYPPGSALACADPKLYTWWKPDPTKADPWAGAPVINVTDAAGNTLATVNYLIHRMCTCNDTLTSVSTCAAGGATQNCQKIQENVTVTGSSMQVGTNKFTATSVFYRITTRSIGPRNTVTYAQEMVLIPE